MNGASKILTVSYGTFSCTLEGFDDPFNTMKAIAEYFRDLAAEDRYFGAEPPTPDAAMLHRIAEREIQRRVEAKIQENGVVLRASDTESATPAGAPAPAQAIPAPAKAEPAVAAAPLAAPAPAPAATPTVAPADAPATESVVAKLSRLRSEVAAQPAAVAPVATMPTVSFVIPDYLEDEHADTIEQAPMSADLVADTLPEDEAPAFEPVEDAPLPEAAKANEDAVLAALTATSDPEPDASAPVNEVTGESAETAAEMSIPPEPQDVDLPESLMAALADSTSGVSPEDVADAAVPPASDPAADEPIADLSALIEDAVIVESTAGAETAEPAASEVTSDAPDAWPEFVADQTATIEHYEDEHVDAVEAAYGRGDQDLPPVATDDAAIDAQEESVEAAFDRSQDDIAATTVEADGETGVELRPGAAEKLQRARARVIRIRRGEDLAPEPAPEPAPQDAAPLDAEPTAPAAPVRPRRVTASTVQPAPGTDMAEPATDPVAQAPAPADDDFETSLSSIFAEVAEDAPLRAPSASATAAPAPASASKEEGEDVESLLSAEDEAELMRELAALRTNEEDGPDGAAAGASAFVLQQDARKGFSGPTADEALGRLIKQTDTEMAGPETKRRQSAIAHLKAAVAATVADRKVTGDQPSDTAVVSRLARYRNDLAMAVKSALPGRGGSDAARERPAPLVLVSEQRIDKPRPAPQASTAPTAAPAAVQPVQPVRPRRVSGTGSGLAMQAAEAFDEDENEDESGNVFGDTQGFEEFVDRVGAVTLEEILEASAAYLAGVEGLDSFSRPQVMHHVGAVVPPGTFQREDGLRGFGTLLRNGRITKLRRGQFVLAEDSAYLAEARKIAG